MKKINAAAKKSAPKFIDDTHVQVTKEFAKNARIFGTPEYKMWKEIRQDCPDAVMVTKTIKKNPDKKNDTKNMTYERMAIYIREQENAVVLMAEFKKQISLSKVQNNPYRSVLAWFIQKFENYDSYKSFFAEEAKKKAQEKDIFTVIKTSAVIMDENNDEDDFDLASGIERDTVALWRLGIWDSNLFPCWSKAQHRWPLWFRCRAQQNLIHTGLAG